MKHLSVLLTRSVLTVIIFAGCTSTTVINSHPEGAKLFMDGSLKGTTPYTYSDTKIVGSSTAIKLTLPGFQDFQGVLTRSERMDVGALVGGIFLLVPFLWIMEYDPDHTYELTKTGEGSGAEDSAVGDADLQTKLQKLKKMFDDNIITKEEYDSLRKKAIDKAK